MSAHSQVITGMVNSQNEDDGRRRKKSISKHRMSSPPDKLSNGRSPNSVQYSNEQTTSQSQRMSKFQYPTIELNVNIRDTKPPYRPPTTSNGDLKRTTEITQSNGQQSMHNTSNGQSLSLNSSQISSLSSESARDSPKDPSKETGVTSSKKENDNQKKPEAALSSDELPNGLIEHTNTDKIVNGHDTSTESDSNSVHDLFPNIVFDLKELFRLSVKFTKDNENKAFHPTYDDRNNLYALNYQIRYGPFVEEKAPQLGALDFVGKDRRLTWKELGDLSKEAAMKKFIGELMRLSPTFKPFIEAHNQERVERERLLREEEERKRIEDEKRLKEEEEERLKRAEVEKKEKQRQEIKEALRKQTYFQFKSYAQQQYPNDPTAQESLIKSLEDIHFQQYLERIQEQQQQSQMDPASSQVNSPQDDLVNSMQQFNLNGDKLATATNASNSSDLNHELDNQFSKINQQDYVNNQRYMVNQEESENEEETDNEDEEEEDEENSDDESEQYDGNYEGKNFQIAPPNMWTKKIIKPFKESISIDSGDGIVKVGYGETLTIRVPTHPDGNCIVWEFATDNYDIGFGLFFEPNENPGDQVTIQVSESEDEEEEEDNDSNGDPERGGLRRKATKKSKTQYVLPIIPIFRRDSHEEVYAGSHVYCGKGVYLLKFDNTYSLWRSKTLYYRVFFSS